MEERPTSGRAWEFEDFVRRLIAAAPRAELIDGDPLPDDRGIDVIAQIDGTPLLAEVKSSTPQTSARLRATIDQLRHYAQDYKEARPTAAQPRLVLAFPGVVSPRKTAHIPPDVELWDGQYLRGEARRLGVDYPEYLAYGDEEEPRETQQPADELMIRLGRLRPGPSDWVGYENFVRMPSTSY